MLSNVALDQESFILFDDDVTLVALPENDQNFLKMEKSQFVTLFDANLSKHSHTCRKSPLNLSM